MVPSHGNFQKLALLILPVYIPGFFMYFLPIYPPHLSPYRLPLPWTDFWIFFYIFLSNIFPALVLVKSQPVGYCICPFPLHVYPLYGSDGYQQHLRSGPSIRRYRHNGLLWGRTVHTTYHYMLEDILNSLQLPSLIVHGIRHSIHPTDYRDSWHFVSAYLVSTLLSSILTLWIQKKRVK